MSLTTLRKFSAGHEVGADSIHEKDGQLRSEVRGIRDQVAQLYIQTFIGGDYGQFVCYPSECKPLPVTNFFGDKKLTLDEYYALDLEQYPHPHTGEHPIFWHDRRIVKKKFERILKKGGLVTLEDGNGQIIGFSAGYTDTIKAMFESEEWQNPIQLSGQRNAEKTRNFDRFLDRINTALSRHVNFNEFEPVTPQTQMNLLHSFVLSETSRGQGHFYKLVSELGKDLNERAKAKRLNITEVVRGSIFSQVFSKAGAIYVPEAFGRGSEDGTESTIMLLHPDDLRYFDNKSGK